MKRILIMAVSAMCVSLSLAKGPVNYTYSDVCQTGILTIEDIMNNVVGLVLPNDGMWSATRKDIAQALKPYHAINIKYYRTISMAYNFPATYKNVKNIGAFCYFDENDILTQYSLTFGQEETGLTFDVLFENLKQDLLAQSVVELPELSKQQTCFSVLWTSIIMGGTFSNKFVGYKGDIRYELIYYRYTQKTQGVILTVVK